LYKFAEELFQSRFNSMVNELKERYFEPKFANLTFKEMIYALLEKHFENGPSPEPVSSIDFDFKKPLSGTGWHTRELFDGKTPFRWTGPQKHSTLNFPKIKDSDLRIELTVISYLSQDILDSLRLEINDAPISLEKKSLKEKIIFEGVIPNSVLDGKKNSTQLILKVDKTISHNSVNPSSTDIRNLGIAFERIRIKPAIQIGEDKD